MAGWRIVFCCVALAAIMSGTIGALATLEEPAEPETPRLVLLTGGADAYWQAVAYGAEAAARARGVELTIEDRSCGTKEVEANRADDCGDAAAVSGVVICQDLRKLIGSSELAEFTKETKLITFGADSWHAERLCHVGMANYSAGRICAMLAQQSLSSGGKILVLVDHAAEGEPAKRLAGFQDAFSSLHLEDQESDWPPQPRVVNCIVDWRDEHGTANALQCSLAENSNVHIVVDLCNCHLGTVIGALAARADAKAPQLITFEQSEAALAAVESGQVLAAMALDPYEQGYQAIDRMAIFCRSGPLGWPAAGKGYVNIVPTVVRQGNVAEFRAQLKAGANPPDA